MKIWWDWHLVDAEGKETRSEKQWITWIDSIHLWTSISSGNIILHWYNGTETYRPRLNAGEYGPARMDSQCANFPDPENFYDFILRGDSTQNQSHYRNEQMDSLLKKAGTEPDWSKKIAYYRTADKMIYDDAPIIMFSYSEPEYII